MFKKLIMKLAIGIQKKEQARQADKKLSEADKQREALYKQLTNLYQFVRWTDKGFRNRKERKSFWKAVGDNVGVMETTILDMTKRYAKRDKKEYEAPPKKKEVKK